MNAGSVILAPNWQGNAQFVTAAELISSISSIVTNISTLPAEISTLRVSSLYVNYLDAAVAISTVDLEATNIKSYLGEFAVTSTVSIDAIQGNFHNVDVLDTTNTFYFTSQYGIISSLTVSTINIPVVTYSTFAALNISTSLLTVSTVRLAPDVKLDPKVTLDLGLGGLIGGAIGALGGQVMSLTLGAIGLATGVASLTTSRTRNFISQPGSYVYETINGTSQIQYSTLGAATQTFFRTVASVSPNQVPGPELIISSIIPAGTSCIRTIGDPLNLASTDVSSNSTIQAFGQWAPVPIITGVTGPLIIDYNTEPALTTSTGVLFQSTMGVPYNGSLPTFSSLSTLSKTFNLFNTTENLFVYPSTNYVTIVSTLGPTTALAPARFTLANGPSLDETFAFIPGSSNQYIDTTGYTFSSAIFNINTHGITGITYISTFGATPATPPLLPPILYAIPAGSTMRITYDYTLAPPHTTPINSIATVPSSLSTFVSSITQNVTRLNQTQSETILQVSTASGFGGFALNCSKVAIGFSTTSNNSIYQTLIAGDTSVTGTLTVGGGTVLANSYTNTATSMTLGGNNIYFDSSFGTNSGGLAMTGLQAPFNTDIMLNPNITVQ